MGLKFITAVNRRRPCAGCARSVWIHRIAGGGLLLRDRSGRKILGRKKR
jgi:hypothetical protein